MNTYSTKEASVKVQVWGRVPTGQHFLKLPLTLSLFSMHYGGRALPWSGAFLFSCVLCAEWRGGGPFIVEREPWGSGDPKEYPPYSLHL